MALNIVGISAHYHDSACCLLRAGELVAAAQEERFTRVKHDSSTPAQAFRYCLEEGGLTIADVDCVAYYEDPAKKLSRQLWMLTWPGISHEQKARILQHIDAHRPVERIRGQLGYDGPIEVVEHHHAHAASSYFFSGFEDAAILTVDGVGEWATTTYGRGRGSDLEILDEVCFPDSIGLLYSTLTAYLGFEVNDGEYKVMGLAPYGQPRYVEQLYKLIDVGEGGAYKLRMEYFEFPHGNRMFSDRLSTLLGRPPRVPESRIEDFHKDVARSLQVVLEEVMLAKARFLYELTPSENLCMAGGVALNCVANSKVLREGPFKRLFVQPAAGDAGGAVGAAAIAHVRLAGVRPSSTPLAHAFLGPGFSSAFIRQLLDATRVPYTDFSGRWRECTADVVRRLTAGKIVGWFQGRMEFGPRALGARSILADPRDPTMRDRVNALVKLRESFRPFAPVVLEDRAAQHFVLDHPSRFMLETCPVQSPLALPAITHVDGSARVQTVDRDSNPRLASLLDEFERATGCPILLNTSFNMRGEPIVCTPTDALLCFVRARLDTLVLEDCLIDAADIPLLWHPFTAKLGLNRESGIDHAVYTFV
jgi:carbamoyltransferase